MISVALVKKQIFLLFFLLLRLKAIELMTKREKELFSEAFHLDKKTKNRRLSYRLFKEKLFLSQQHLRKLVCYFAFPLLTSSLLLFLISFFLLPPLFPPSSWVDHLNLLDLLAMLFSSVTIPVLLLSYFLFSLQLRSPIGIDLCCEEKKVLLFLQDKNLYWRYPNGSDKEKEALKKLITLLCSRRKGWLPLLKKSPKQLIHSPYLSLHKNQLLYEKTISLEL